MRSGIRGVLVGALALTALQTLVQTPSAARVAGLFRVPGQIARRFIDPTVAAIPDTQTKVVGKVDELGSGLRGGRSNTPARSSYPDPFTPPQITPVPTGGD